MEHLRKLQNHPVALIIVWLPTIALLPGDWITIGGAVTSDTNLTRLALGLAGLLAILWATGRLSPRLSPAAAQEPPSARAGYEMGAAQQRDPVERHSAVVGTAADPRPSPGRRIYGSDAIQQAIFENARREDRAAVEAEFVTMIEEGKKLCEEEFTGNLSWQPYYHWRQGLMEFIGTVLGDAERQRFIEVEVADPKPRHHVTAVMEWLRERRDHPNNWTLRVGGEELAAAIRKRYEVDQVPPGTKTLADQLDALMREGMELLDELMAPPQAEETGEGEWALEFGDAPPEWNDKANAFYKTIKDLLAAEHPALIPDFEKGYNERLRIQRERETRKVASRQPDNRSQAQRTLDFATDTQRTPAKVVEACLEGLSHARKAI